MSPPRRVCSSTSTGTRSSRIRGLLGHWYAGIAMVFAAATLMLETLYRTIVGRVILGVEAEMVSWALERLGARIIHITSTTFIVLGYGNALSITMAPQCSGVYGAIAFTIMALLMPHVPLRRKAYALGIYAPLILLANIERVLVTVIVGLRQGMRAFQYTHSYVASILMIVVFTVLWIDWFYRSLASQMGRAGMDASPSPRR